MTQVAIRLALYLLPCCMRLTERFVCNSRGMDEPRDNLTTKTIFHHVQRAVTSIDGKVIRSRESAITPWFAYFILIAKGFVVREEPAHKKCRNNHEECADDDLADREFMFWHSVFDV